MSAFRVAVGAFTALLVSLLISILGGSPASAVDRTIKDRTGDAPSQIDITAVDYSVTSSTYAARMSVRDLRRSGTFRLAVQYDSGDAAYRTLTVGRDRDGQPTLRVHNVDRGGTVRVACPGAKGALRPRMDRVWLSLPRSCVLPERAISLQVSGRLGNRHFDESRAKLL